MEGGADLAVPGVGYSQEPPTPGHCERLLCYFQAKSELCISSPYCFVKQYLQSTENVLFSHRIAFLSILWASVGSLICGPAPWSPKGPGMQLYFRITSFLVTQHILFHTFKRIILRSLQASLDGTKMVISSRLPWVKGIYSLHFPPYQLQNQFLWSYTFHIFPPGNLLSKPSLSDYFLDPQKELKCPRKDYCC